MLPILLNLLLAASPHPGDTGSVHFKEHRFRAEVARTDADRARGLMGRATLAKDQCMIFLYEEDGYHAIWMKNCLIALDVAWTAEDGTVVETAEDVPPCSPLLGEDCPNYGGRVKSRYFVEFPAGTFRRLQLHRGDRLGWELQLGGRRMTGGAVPRGGRRK